MNGSMILHAPKEAVSDVQAVPTTERNSQIMSIKWLNLLNAIPVIAGGVQMVHKDLALKDKVMVAGDILNTITTSAAVSLDGPAQQEAIAIGSAAQALLAQFVTALHHSTPAAPVAGAV